MAEKVAKNNQLLIIDKNNVMEQRAGYLAIPWTFKKIMNRVLTPREVAVYIQIAFYMDKHEVCYPSLDELAEGMQGVSRGNQLSGTIQKLVDKGFLLKTKKPLPWRKEKYKKLIFQRPSVKYTLQTLRIQNRIMQDEYETALQAWERTTKGEDKKAKVAKA